jgi:hypothetical protein
MPLPRHDEPSEPDAGVRDAAGAAAPPLARGEVVYGRHFQRDQLGGLFPLHAVQDGPDGFLCWAPAGTTYWHFNMPDGRTMAQTPFPEWASTLRVPAAQRMTHGVLTWHPRGADYSIRWFYRPSGQFYAWYANLEYPAARWRDGELAGFDTVDWDLDIWVHPDRRWEWKDEALMVSRLHFLDLYWVDDPDRVRRAGRTVVSIVEAGAFPFDGTWCDFRPDATWPALPAEMPTGWNRPRCQA